MKTVLLDEAPLLILPPLAMAVGSNEAIMLQQVHYWLALRGKHFVMEQTSVVIPALDNNDCVV